MHLAYIVDGSIQSVSDEPSGGREISSGAWVDKPEEGWTLETLASLGYYPVVDTPKPEDTATTVYVSSVEMVDGVPTQVWTATARPSEEVAAFTGEQNEKTIKDALESSLGELQTLIDTPNSTINSGPAPYIKVLARAIRRIIRLLIRKLDGTT